MTIERELLEKILNTGWLNHELSCEVEAILAQPEPTEQEPVAWMYEWEEIGGKEWTSVKNGKYPPIVEEEYCMRNLRPLYTAPPKREPISFEDLNTMWCGNPIDFARCIESIHGIGVDDE